MKREIIIIAALDISNEWNLHRLSDGGCFLSGPGHWHTTAANQCLAAIDGLKSESEHFLIKVLTTAPSDSVFSQAVRSLNPDIYLTGYAIQNTDAITKAIAGAYGVFLVTDVRYDQEDSVTKEFSLGRSVAEACLRANVQHVIYSTQMHVYASIGLRADACDAKAHVSDHLTESGVAKTLLVIPFFYEDFLFGVLKPVQSDQQNVLKIVAATGHIAIDSISYRDCGSCIKTLFLKSEQWIGKTIALSGDKMTITDYARVLTNRSRNNTFLDAQITPDEFLERSEWDGAEDLANYFDYLTRSVRRNNQESTLSLNNRIISFYDWAEANQAAINQL